MLQIEQVQDLETLRQIARIQERENVRLRERLQQLLREIAQLRGQDDEQAQRRLQFELERLEKLLSPKEREQTGRTEPRSTGENPSGDSEHARRHGHGPRPQARLPVQEKVYELPPSERTCPVCQGTLLEMGNQTEDSEEITVIEPQYVLVQQKRQKYRCRCNAAVVTAPGPLKLQPGGRYSLEFAVHVATSKFVDHTPLERQVSIMRRGGLEIDSQTLWDQTDVLAGPLVPVRDALKQQVLQSPVVFADETGWRLIQKGGSQHWTLWEVASEDAVFYQLAPDRSNATGRTLLGDYHGTVMADGYGVYESLSAEGMRFKLANCWAHAGAKFKEIQENFPQVREVLDLIHKLYEVEQQVPDLRPWTPAAQRAEILELRAKLRREQSKPVIDAIRDWLYTQYGLPESGFGAAVRYVLNRWQTLKTFLGDPRVPLSNNAAERNLRGAVLGRKNFNGCRSKRGMEVAALFYTLFGSAKLCGVDPHDYVLHAARAMIQDGTVLLPHSLMPAE